MFLLLCMPRWSPSHSIPDVDLEMRRFRQGRRRCALDFLPETRKKSAIRCFHHLRPDSKLQGSPSAQHKHFLGFLRWIRASVSHL